MEYSKKVDQKWQERWEKEDLYKFDKNSKKEKYYTLEMFSYPSGAKLHLGHWFNYGPSDSFARFKKMKGYNVFHPMGFDAFGLPAENYAIKTGIHPEDSTIKNIETMKKQLKEMGGSYDWNYTVETCMPDYYKWTQWIFLKLYEAGLAYKKEAPVNWCDSCKTVLANEQVIDSKCERCGNTVKRKKMEQWFFKITDYAEELLDGLKTIDWPESTKKVQINWIGKSEGTEITFSVENEKFKFNVFTTRPDTVNGVTYVVIAPESKIVQEITTPEYKEAVEKYIQDTLKLNEIDRLSTERTKTGVFTGAYAINPVNQEKIPIWIADYVLEDYGTGAVMAVPAHDERDFEFAKKYNLPIKRVIKSEEGETELPYTEKGILINSGKYDGLTSEEAKNKITEDLEKEQKGRKSINYRLKDWLVSRQRYWGAPIPIIYCDKCGIVPVPEKDLPVLLPYDVEFTPDGESPLKKSKEFIECTCPKCGGKATREADTLDTFVCSSWYELRYPDSKNSEKAFDKEIVNKMLPVDTYIGGKEHAAMHLIYARFMTKALRDLGYLDFDEPFKRLVHQGMILGPDGNKMSKSKGNTVSPEEYIEKYGSDVFRTYLMFGFDFKKGGPWNEKGLEAIVRYFSKIERLIQKFIEMKNIENNDKIGSNEKELLRIKNLTIKAMEKDMEEFQFNTAIARSMEFLNSINKYINENKEINKTVLKEIIETYIKLLAPLAPHFTEEQWEKLGKTTSIHKEDWPIINEKEMQGGTKDIPVQVNGKLKCCVSVDADASAEEILIKIKENEKVKEIFQKNNIKKEIYVPGKIYNLVVEKQ